MGRIKSLLIDSNEHDRQAIEALKPKVHVLTCNERPVGVYVDRMTAEYEMHLCIQGDADELGICSDYAVHTFDLSTHRLD